MYDMVFGFHREYRFLSNFALLPLYPGEPRYLVEETPEGLIHYPTVEHAYQASKTLNVKQREEIALLPRPSQAKRAGRGLRLRPKWDNIRSDIMYDLLVQKFRNPTLRQLLLDTGSKKLKHVNDHGDTYWGCDRFLEGDDRLGVLLMQLRDELQQAV